MSHKDPISAQDLQEHQLTGWQLDDGVLVAALSVPSFTQGAQLLLEIAQHADDVDHHPQLILDYGVLTVRGASHDAGGRATQRDLRMAVFIHGLVLERQLSYQEAD